MVVLQLAEALRARGHLVHPVVPAGREGWLLDQFRASGFAWHGYDLRRPVDVRFPGRLAAMLERLNVDVVHSHEFVMAVYGAAAARRIGRRHVITMHGSQTMTLKYRRRAALRWAFRKSHATIAVSEDTRRHLESSLRVRNGVLQVIPNGIPERMGDRKRIRQELGVAESDLLLLSVGNLTPRKGHAVLIEALIKLMQNGDDSPWQLAIAGEGPERPRLEGIVRDAGINDRVHLLGSRNDVADLQAAADIFVLPSLWEGLPLAVLEAMFGGNAIIASDTSGIPEAIENGRHGLLTPPGEVAPLAEALRIVMTDTPRRQQLGAAALERARKHFTIDAMTSAYESYYR